MLLTEGLSAIATSVYKGCLAVQNFGEDCLIPPKPKKLTTVGLDYGVIINAQNRLNDQSINVARHITAAIGTLYLFTMFASAVNHAKNGEFLLSSNILGTMFVGVLPLYKAVNEATYAALHPFMSTRLNEGVRDWARCERVDLTS